jgi:hypothetical protein
MSEKVEMKNKCWATYKLREEFFRIHEVIFARIVKVFGTRCVFTGSRPKRRLAGYNLPPPNQNLKENTDSVHRIIYLYMIYHSAKISHRSGLMTSTLEI